MFSKKTNKDFVPSTNCPQIPLTDQLIKNFTFVLGPEAVKCHKNLKQIKVLKDSQVLSAFKDIFSKFGTVPVLFLSVIPKEAVYLWQINRKCPYKEGTKYMVLDSKGLSKTTRRHISILMLAKITASKDEILLNANLVEDNQLLVNFQLSPKSTQAVIKLYEIKKFVDSVRVNPYKYEVLANNLYSSSFILKGGKIGDEECLEISRYKHNLEGKGVETDKIVNETDTEEHEITDTIIIPAESENLQEAKIIKNIKYSFKADSQTFLEVLSNSFFLLNKSDALFLAIQGNSFWIINYGPKVGEIKTITYLDGIYYLVNSGNKIFALKVNNFPNITIIDLEISFSLNQKRFCEISKVYEIVLCEKVPTFFYFRDNRIIGLPFEKKAIKNICLSADLVMKNKPSQRAAHGGKLGWGLFGSKKSLAISVFNGIISIYDLQDEENKEPKVNFDIPGNTSFQEWEIINSKKNTYVLGNYCMNLNHFIKVTMNDKNPLNVSFSFIETKNRKLGISRAKKLFYQIEGSDDQIIFIRGADEYLYMDVEHLMYSNSIFLLNPQGEIKCSSDSEIAINGKDDEEKRNKLREKIELVKDAGRSHVRDKERGIQETKDALRKMRADIKRRLTEGVAKESLELYQEIKKEKKKIEMQKDKQKTKEKKERTQKF